MPRSSRFRGPVAARNLTAGATIVLLGAIVTLLGI